MRVKRRIGDQRVTWVFPLFGWAQCEDGVAVWLRRVWTIQTWEPNRHGCLQWCYSNRFWSTREGAEAAMRQDAGGVLGASQQ
jgi:hypothetical protein